MIPAAQNFVGQTHNMVVDGKIQKREYIIPPDEDSDDEEYSEEEVTLSETEESNDKSDEDDSLVYEEAADDAEEGELVGLGTLNQTTNGKQGEEGDSEATCDDNIDPGELLEEILVIDESDQMEAKPDVDEIEASFENGGEKAFVNPLDQTHITGEAQMQSEEFGFGENKKMEKFGFEEKMEIEESGFEEKMEIEDPGPEEWKQLEMLPEGWKFKESPKIKGGKKVLCQVFLDYLDL